MSVKSVVGVVQNAALPAAEPVNLLANEVVGGGAAEATFELREEDGIHQYIIPRNKYFLLNTAIVAERRDRPVYLEAEEETSEVVRLLEPRVRRVEEAVEVQGLLYVRLDASPARYFLSPLRPHAAWELLKMAGVDRSELLITDDPTTHEILDVQIPSAPANPEPTFDPLGPEPDPTVLTLDQAKEVFRFLAHQPHIAFDYADDCCTSRAHEMFRLLRDDLQIHCRKVWNYGGGGDFRHGALRFFTPNHPEGLVRWLFHVAPVVKVKLPGGMEVDMVLDPAVFDRPARVPVWVAVQHDTLAVQEFTRPEIFLQWLDDRDFPPRRDDLFEDTRRFMEIHHRERMRRILDLTP